MMFLSGADYRFSLSVSLRVGIDRGETRGRSRLSDEIRRGHVSIESNCRCEELVIGGEEMPNLRFSFKFLCGLDDTVDDSQHRSCSLQRTRSRLGTFDRTNIRVSCEQAHTMVYHMFDRTGKMPRRRGSSSQLI